MRQEFKTCLHCGKLIKTGRSDKKFCDSGCKDAYYNEIKTGEHTEIKKVESILRKNRRILKRLHIPRSERLISKQLLIKAGFEFDYHTHFIITKIKSNQFIFCYDYGYREAEPGKIRIIKSF